MQEDDQRSTPIYHQREGSLIESITMGILTLDPYGNSQQRAFASSG
jgi:hypothetical protein